MKITCGTDIIEIKRIKKSIEELGEKFLKHVYTDDEIKYCESKNNQKYQHYAARFAAKEAIFKAVSNNLNNKYDIGWKNLEVLNDKNGRPYIHFLNTEFEKIGEMDISISHCKEYATANVVILWN